MVTFLLGNSKKKLCARVTGKRKREVGLVVPAKFSALTAELRVNLTQEQKSTVTLN